MLEEDPDAGTSSDGYDLPSLPTQVPTSAVDETVDPMPDDDFGIVTDWSQTFKLSQTDDNIVSYLAGYAMKKMSSRFDCNKCRDAYELSHNRSQGELYQCDNSRLYFIQCKTYNWAKHGLVTPSQELYSLCTNIEKVVQMNLEKLSSGRNIMQNLKDCISLTIDLSSYRIESVCDDHHQQQFEYLLNLLLRVRIHHFVRIRNRELQEMEHSRKMKLNRKAKKVMHH